MCFNYIKETKEFCGVVAVWRNNGQPAAPLAHRGLFALQHRGEEAAGIATCSLDGELLHLKGRGLVAESLPTYRVKDLIGDRAVGHVRYSTVNADRAENIQPFIASTPYGRIAIAHNGNLKNSNELTNELEAEGALLSTTMDTELIVHLLARSHAVNFADALRAVAKRALGAYSLTLLCDGRVYGLRDALGIRPLVLGSLKDGWVIASETCALDAMDAKFEREVRPGELIEIGPEGVKSIDLLPKAKRLAPCVFELVYFSRPNSTIFGQSVYAARNRMGVELARQDASESMRPDVVIPIPDSGNPAAIGYAHESGIPLEYGIIRSHYVGRTFILPDQDTRSHRLRLKLSIIREIVTQKRVLLIDDSVVRGNTSRMIVAMVREAGAREVWMRVASPPIAWPCYLGIDTPTREELIINREGSVDGVAQFLKCDNLRYLSIEALARAVNSNEHCYACMNGDYPV
ncbi:MAG: amidophosphoribosyltransferase [Deltaproteobacteria bacterium]|nr:amidophosphoribosyltransferase [Deltaproteobacteria bacterium]